MSQNTAADPSSEPAAHQPGPSASSRARGAQAAIEDSLQGLEQRYSQARDQLEKANTEAVSFIRAHPVACIAGAVAVGYLVGRLASNRWLT